MAELRRNCELCPGEASFYCPSDSAFLCATCDANVHCANFLVARHVRLRICHQCRNIDGTRFSGAGVSVPRKISCRTCKAGAAGDEDTDSLSSSSSCVSSTGTTGEEGEVGGTASASSTSSRKRKESSRRCGRFAAAVDLKVEGVLVNWCRRLGVEDERLVKMAVEMLTGCLDKMTVLPFRVALAAAFWVAMRVCCGDGAGGDSTCHDLRRLEQISGVPAKLILATESRLARVLKRNRSREDHVEGWAEC